MKGAGGAVSINIGTLDAAWNLGYVEKKQQKITLPETNSEFTPENGWLEYDRFLLGWPILRCYVSCREGMIRARFFEFLCYMEIFLSV